ncbi:MAG: cystathionine beta-synthase [Chloroflexota bacterium]|jgi:cystathionine beta-synthase|nr:cystathionine beta-synthase [Chloroflexota bacterium]
MQYAESILDLVGETPLVRLQRVTRELGAVDRQPLILAKLELLNPGGSVKDRIGLPMIEAAERAGLLKPGGTIIEPTSGNTGHGLAIAAALKGYRCIFVMADKQSVEKQALLRAYGAEVVLCPTNVPPESPESYYSVARRLTRDIPGAFQPDQYHNMENPRAHELTTGPEIWRQTDGRVTHVVVAVGTGGTVSGLAHYLKGQNPDIQIIGADPEGSVLSGDTARPYLTEGIGEDFFPGTFDPATVDRWVRVSDADAFAAARRITREEGILAGESCGTALVAALTVGRELTAADGGRDAVMVVVLPDGGRSYLSKLYNDEWMRINGLLGSPTGRTRVSAVLRNGHRDDEIPSLVLVRTTDRVASAIDMLERYGISQMPVTERDDDAIDGIVGSLNERSLLERAYRDPTVVERTVGEVMDRPLPTIAAGASVDEAFRLLSEGAPALVAVENGRPTGVVTKLDLLEHLAHQPTPRG